MTGTVNSSPPSSKGVNNMYYYYRFKKYVDFFKWFRDLIVLIFGDKQTRQFISKVPSYCRYECNCVFECRNPAKEWKCKRGCLLLNVENRSTKQKYRS